MRTGHLLWNSKQRSGVVSNMVLSEWKSKQIETYQTVVIVSKHKTGDKEPAALVMDVAMAVRLATVSGQLLNLYTRVS